MNKILKFITKSGLSLVMAVCMVTVNVSAVWYRYKATDRAGLNLRIGPGTEYAKKPWCGVWYGDEFTVTEKRSDTQGRQWGKTYYRNNEGWVCLNYATFMCHVPDPNEEARKREAERQRQIAIEKQRREAEERQRQERIKKEQEAAKQRELEALKKKNQELEKELAEARKTIEGLNLKIAELESEVATLEKSVAELKLENTQLKKSSIYAYFQSKKEALKKVKDDLFKWKKKEGDLTRQLQKN